MPRVHEVKHARKAIPSIGVKKGDPYFWWKFNFGPKLCSKTYPKRSQLTRSDFLAQVYDIEDRLADLDAAIYVDDPSSLSSDLADIASEIRSLGEECDSRRESMPESLQDSDTGQLLQERYDACEAWADELEGIDVDDIRREDVEADLRAEQEKMAEAERFNAEALEEEIDSRYQDAVREAIEAAISEAQSAEAPSS